MAKTLAELIADAAAEDMEFAAPDGTKVKLSEIKGFRSQTETERQAAERFRKEAERTAGEAKQIFDALKAAQDEMNKQTPKDDGKAAKGSDWRKNPLYDEIIPVFDALEAKANSAMELVGKVSKSLETSQAQYIAEKFKREWAEAKVKPKDKQFQDVVAEVLKAQELDELGLPTLNKYLYRSTEQDRINAAVTEGVEKARKDWEKQHAAAGIPKPGKFQTRKSGEGPIKKLDELTSDVLLNDPDFQDLGTLQ